MQQVRVITQVIGIQCTIDTKGDMQRRSEVGLSMDVHAFKGWEILLK
jgi:hypothetical protein